MANPNRTPNALEPLDPHWAMHEPIGLNAFTVLNRLTLSETLQLVAANCAYIDEEDLRPYDMHGRTALIPISGSITKRASWLSYYFGGTASERVMSMVEDALVDDAVDRICLVIDSPGGQVSGTGELADLLFEANRTKPVYAFCNGLCASAAYWLASQAKKIGCTPQSMVGSIGTYMALMDSHRYYEEMGIKVLVFREGKYKGAGTPGTKITAEQQSEFQREISALNDQFLAAVSRGRALSPEATRKLNDGRVHVGEAAKSEGLVDHVCSYQAFLDMIGSGATTPHSPADAATRTAVGNKPQGDVSSMEKNKVLAILAEAQALLNGETETDANVEQKPAATVETPAPAATAPALNDEQKAAVEAVPALAELVKSLTSTVATLSTELKAVRDGEASRESATYAQKAADRVEAAIVARKVTPAERESLCQLAADNRERFEGKMEAIEASNPILAVTERIVNAQELVADAGSATEEFMAKVNEKVKAGATHSDAYRAVGKEHPELAQRVRAEETSEKPA